MMDVDGIIPMDYLTVLSDKVEMVSRRIQKNLDSAPKDCIGPEQMEHGNFQSAG